MQWYCNVAECGSHRRQQGVSVAMSQVPRVTIARPLLRVLRRLPQRQRPLKVAPPPPRPLPPTPQVRTEGLRRSGRARRRVTPASTQYATSSSCSSGANNGRCDDGDDGEFTLDTAEVAEEAAVERKEVRRVKPLLSELQVPEWQELAKDRLEWKKMLKSIRIWR